MMGSLQLTKIKAKRIKRKQFEQRINSIYGSWFVADQVEVDHVG